MTTATIKLSAASAAATKPESIFIMSATATKLTAPPICRAHNAAAIFSAPTNPFIGTAIQAISVPNIVPKEPIINARNNLPVTAKHFFKSASNSNKGIANGTNTFITFEYTGDELGMIPILQRTKQITIVTNGLDKIDPILDFSANNPNVDAEERIATINHITI